MFFPDFMFLLFSYAICFGLQHKVPFLHNKSDFLDKMLECTYCTGFHSGWISWVFVFSCLGQYPAETVVANIGSAVSWAFVSAISCYAFDTIVKWVEVHSAVEEEFEEEEEG